MIDGVKGSRAERPRRQSHTFCDPIALMRWSRMYSKAVSVEWCLQ